MTERADWELLEASAAGDAESFRVLVDRHQRSATAFATQVLGDPSAAEDVVQRGFANVFRARERLERRAQFRTLLLRIVLNLALNEIRRRERDPRPLSLLGSGDDEGAGARSIADGRSPDPAVEAEKREVDDMVRQALATLRPEHRGALYLREQRGLSYQEIADALDASLAEVKIWIHRARKKMLERLAPYLERGEGVS